MTHLNGSERSTRYFFQLVVTLLFHDATDESRNMEEDGGGGSVLGQDRQTDLARRTRTSVKELLEHRSLQTTELV